MTPATAVESGASRASSQPVVIPDQFLVATRDTGYRSTSMCLAELVDNAIEARATTVTIEVTNAGDTAYPIQIAVSDDGIGMTAGTLATALAFGGSTRFGSRASLGRYGMGLPNGGLSRARRIEVETSRGSGAYSAVLDLDELVTTRSMSLPPVKRSRNGAHRSGTTVRLLKCDRLENRKAAPLAAKIASDLARVYRRFLDAGLIISVNGSPLVASDPLFLSSPDVPAAMFGDTLTYRINTQLGEGDIRVTFSELAVAQLHNIANDEKRVRGITGAPNVSVLRAGREIDRGWFFMGGKRRENYDDWWRCEIDFDPVLDEMFGITHSKQTVRPTSDLRQLLERDLEPIARALNARVRQSFEIAKASTPLDDAVRRASQANLPPLPPSKRRLASQAPGGIRVLGGPTSSRSKQQYRIYPSEFDTTEAYRVMRSRRETRLYLNVRHPLYRDIYEPLAVSDRSDDQRRASDVALLILAAARTQLALEDSEQSDLLDLFRNGWSNAVASFLHA